MKLKEIILAALMLAFLILNLSCGKGGSSAGGGGSVTPTPTPAPIYQYDFVLMSASSAHIRAGLYTNFGDSDQVEILVNATWTSGQDVKMYGRNSLYQIINDEATPITIRVCKDSDPYLSCTPLNDYVIPAGGQINDQDGI